LRYGVIPTRAVEWLALLLRQVPHPMLDAVIAPLQTRTLIVAQRSGLLTRLQTPAPLAVLARELSLDEQCLGMVLRVLRSMRYASERKGQWQLSALGRRFFGQAASQPCGALVEHAFSQWRMLEQLETVLHTGRGVDYHDHQSPEDWDAYQRAMLEVAQQFAWFVADHVPVARGATRCLDLAGSHGFVGAAVCRKHRGLRATVLDRAEALPHAQKLAAEYGYDELVRFEVGDLRALALDGEVDVALLNNILHHFSEHENRQILSRVFTSLKPGGSVGIFDFETPDPAASADAAGDGLALYFRISSTSACFRGADYVRWLEQAGFSAPRCVRSVRLPSRVLVVATKT
jgi:ubiquinone/menaquinone biosynthesis C-methylase UbiE